MSISTPPSPAPRAAGRQALPARLSGDVVYLYAFDIAYELFRTPIRDLLGQPVAQFVVDSSKRFPRQLFFYRPQMVRLPPLEKFGPRGPIRIERSVKILPVGAISISVRIPFDVERVEDLVAYHDLRFSDGTYLYDDVRELADQVHRELRPYCSRPVDRLGDEEAYTVFCIHGPLRDASDQIIPAEPWLDRSRREIAALLTEEVDPRQLSEQEADESTGKSFSYYQNDAVVVDWDAALILDEPRYVDEVLYIMELANVQLAELEAYDRLLDDAVETSYRDVARARRFFGMRATRAQRNLQELRIDLARLADELGNITKFFGDWHLARIYQGLSARFHLGDWHQSIDQKLRMLDDMYQLIRSDFTNRWMIVLEATIVLLILFDIVKSILGL